MKYDKMQAKKSSRGLDLPPPPFMGFETIEINLVLLYFCLL